jgi:hypothetical protein
MFMTRCRVGANSQQEGVRGALKRLQTPGVETKKKARPKRDAPSNKIVWQLLVGLSL